MMQQNYPLSAISDSGRVPGSVKSPEYLTYFAYGFYLLKVL